MLLLGFFVTTIMSGQTITGTVSDSSGPLPGANVFVKNTGNGTTTDFDGNYTLENVANDAVVVVSFLGYTTQEIIAGGRNEIDIVLQEDLASLEEVVVVGYSSKSTRDITGSIEVVDIENLQKTAPLSVEQALQGQASGVSVSSQGGPGGTAAVRIRGISSFNGADPLYVIDGTPTTSGINEINPSDIESIQVLKDASSASIYGNRAANGVIIITTKKGKRNGKVQFSVDTWTGIDFIPSSAFPDLASPQQIANSIWQAQANTSITNAADADPDNDVPLTPNHPQYGNGSVPVLPNYIIPAGASSVDLSTYDSESNRISLANKEGTDWFGAYFAPAVVHNTSISASGGSEKSNYFLGLGILDQNGVGLETYYNRYNARMNSQFSVTDNFRIGQNMNLTYSESVQFDSGEEDNDINNAIISLYRMNPLIPVYDVQGGFSGSQARNLGNGQNPIATAINNKDNKDNRFRATGNFYAEIDFLKNFTAKSNFGLDFYTREKRNFRPSRFFDEAIVAGNSLTETNNIDANYNWFNTLTYNTILGDNHNIKAMIGSELVQNRSKFTGAVGNNLRYEDDLDSQYLDLAEAGSTSAYGGGNKSALFSLFALVDYKFADKYILSGSVRSDSSSKFGVLDSDLRQGYFYAGSLGWRISNESFLKDSDVVTNLMLKAGYGEIGGDGIPSGRDQDGYSSNPQFDAYYIGGELVSGIALSSLGNDLITWETKTTINAGFDLTLFNKIDVEFEYFDTNTVDLLTLITLDPSTSGGANNIARNSGEVSNKGFDLNLGFRDETSGGFKYGVSANISAYKNEVLEVDPNDDDAQIFGSSYAFEIGTINNTTKGEPMSSFFGYNYQGIDQTTGRAIFEDIDGDGDIDGDDRVFIGNPHPDFTYGINLNAEYKNIDISILFQGSQGNDIYNLTRVFTDTGIFDGAKSIDYVNAWTPTNTGASVPSLTIDSDINQLERQASSRFVEDGSYLRLKNIQIGYTIPKGFTERLNIEKLRIYVQGKNLLTFTDYSGLDPEISVRNFSNQADAEDIRSNNLRSLGVDTGAYPISRSILMGVNLSF